MKALARAGTASVVALAMTLSSMLLGACEDGSESTTGSEQAQPDPQLSPAFQEWPEVPAPPGAGPPQSQSSSPFRYEAYFRLQPGTQQDYQRLVDLYQQALASLGDVQRPESGQREGETTLRVEAADGRVAEIVIHTRGPDNTVDVRMVLRGPGA